MSTSINTHSGCHHNLISLSPAANLPTHTTYLMIRRLLQRTCTCMHDHTSWSRLFFMNSYRYVMTFVRAFCALIWRRLFLLSHFVGLLWIYLLLLSLSRFTLSIINIWHLRINSWQMASTDLRKTMFSPEPASALPHAPCSIRPPGTPAHLRIWIRGSVSVSGPVHRRPAPPAVPVFPMEIPICCRVISDAV
jgi:hypothetical protein